MKPKSITATLVLLMSGTANALDGLPQYDSAAFCKATSSIIVVNEDFTKTMIEACMKKEQQAPDQITRVIPYVSAATIDACSVMTKAYAGGSYQGFAGCLALSVMQPILDGNLELSWPKKK
jgi:hypothetical protein